MKTGCDLEALEALVAETLPPERALAVEAHARSCASCRDELAWQRTERRLMSERKSAEPGLPPDLWRRVESRIVGSKPRAPLAFWRWRFAFPVLGGAAALAAAVLLAWPRPPASTSSRASEPASVASLAGVDEVLDAALLEYEQAVALLEKDLRRSRRKPPAAEMAALERRSGPARQQLSDARAGADPESRLRALDGYADYVRSLQAVVLAVEGGGRNTE